MTCNQCHIHWLPDELREGQEVELLQLNDEGVWTSLGRVVLIEEVASWRKPEPYPVIEKCSKCKRQVNAINSRWLVRMPDGFETARWVPKYFGVGTFAIEEKDQEDDIFDNENEDTFMA